MRKKLLIISHTEHYLKDGEAVGWGPTIAEINYLASYWEEVVHIGCLYDEPAPPSSRRYEPKNVRFRAIAPYGGRSILDKLGILLKLPGIIKTIRAELKGCTEVQLRLPTGMGVFLLPWFSTRNKNYTFWVKYAGNWAQEKPPVGYAFQRWWLKRNFANCKVTINGYWPNQPDHCVSFENPCLTDHEISEGKPLAQAKSFSPPYRLLFVGQLRQNKGVDRILTALNGIPQNLVSKMVFAGDGPEIEAYRQSAKSLEVPCHFLGFQSRENVHELMRNAHFILLPSDSEGFPKVVAEAACYGTIPVVSDVSSIPHYIHDQNGFLWSLDSSFQTCLQLALSASDDELKDKSMSVLKVAEMFTFESFYAKLEKYIL